MAKSARSGEAPSGSDATSAAEAASVAGMTYEAALGELEALVRKVEEGALSLEDGIRAHRRAVLLLRHCEAILNTAQTQIEELAGRDLPPAPDEPG